VVTADGVACIAAPPPEGVKVTITLAAGIVPAGKPDPVTLTTVVPGVPADGAVVERRVTCANAEEAARESAQRNIEVMTRKYLKRAFMENPSAEKQKGAQKSPLTSQTVSVLRCE
jgi:hypothetical protein